MVAWHPPWRCHLVSKPYFFLEDSFSFGNGTVSNQRLALWLMSVFLSQWAGRPFVLCEYPPPCQPVLFFTSFGIFVTQGRVTLFPDTNTGEQSLYLRVCQGQGRKLNLEGGWGWSPGKEGGERVSFLFLTWIWMLSSGWNLAAQRCFNTSYLKQ